MRNEKGQFVKGLTPHNKKWSGVCKIFGCERTDMKAFGMCHKHYKNMQGRRKNGQDYSNEALAKRLPRTEEHIRNNTNPRIGKTNSLNGKTYKDIYGDKAEEIANKKRGENSGTWQGGKSFEEYPEEFNSSLKLSIRIRDSFKCAECGTPEKESNRALDIHHIDENKKNSNESNLISLCKSCHRKVHNTKQDWINYFTNILKEKENGCCPHSWI